MLRILLVSARPETLRAFIEGLGSDPDVRLEQAGTGKEALDAVRNAFPHLAIVDSELLGTESLSLVSKLIEVNAMVNTAVLSPLSENEFHEASEGLGVLSALPLLPGRRDATELLRRLRDVLGFVG